MGYADMHINKSFYIGFGVVYYLNIICYSRYTGNEVAALHSSNISTNWKSTGFLLLTRKGS